MLLEVVFFVYFIKIRKQYVYIYFWLYYQTVFNLKILSSLIYSLYIFIKYKDKIALVRTLILPSITLNLSCSITSLVL